ncbi:DUF58 domain-containing protein [Schaalia sp. 19OD2882]|uniref:DUF58 domain-containing protein n=1 Tax=Schaalia sp. 19OD2882 TaxID=2794089 RepID=UPI001C1F0EB8|nr:DUF58 domain-containing protein [Schaalia sp. 19OD2882]QWW20302.1 DUF58 domain-containing protein [Schaalia sp. 19OD2882]
MALSWRAALLVALGVVPVIVWPSTALAWGWILLALLVCVMDMALAVPASRLELLREVESTLRADETTPSRITLHNPTNRGLHVVVRDAWQPSMRPSPARHDIRLPAGTTTTVETILAPERRGTRSADYVTLRVWGPLGLAARQSSVTAPLTVSVLPEFRARKLLPSRLARLHELEGTTATVLRGPGTEFDSLREYVRGDDPRDIDWRASARSKELVVRTWRPERDRHVVLVLDTGRSGAMLLGAPRGVGKDADVLDLGVAPRLDAGIEAAFLLGALADRAGDQVHMIAMDRQVRARVSGVRGAGFMRNAAHDLVDVAPSLEPVDWAAVVAEVNRTVRHTSLVVLFTEVPPVGSDPDLLDAISQLGSRHRVIVASAQDPDLARLAAARADAAQVHTAASAMSSLAEEELGGTDLSRAGAHVISVDAGLLAARTSDTYIAFKKAGLL